MQVNVKLVLVDWAIDDGQQNEIVSTCMKGWEGTVPLIYSIKVLLRTLTIGR